MHLVHLGRKKLNLLFHHDDTYCLSIVSQSSTTKRKKLFSKTMHGNKGRWLGGFKIPKIQFNQ